MSTIGFSIDISCTRCSIKYSTVTHITTRWQESCIYYIFLVWLSFQPGHSFRVLNNFEKYKTEFQDAEKSIAVQQPISIYHFSLTNNRNFFRFSSNSHHELLKLLPYHCNSQTHNGTSSKLVVSDLKTCCGPVSAHLHRSLVRILPLATSRCFREN